LRPSRNRPLALGFGPTSESAEANILFTSLTISSAPPGSWTTARKVSEPAPGAVAKQVPPCGVAIEITLRSFARTPCGSSFDQTPEASASRQLNRKASTPPTLWPTK
jgi:hypothetical protein